LSALASRIRDAQQRRIPYIAVIGRREAQDGTVAVRLRDATRLEPQRVDTFIELLNQVIVGRVATLLPPAASRR
jgi:threonyl-tRNA synthetase